MHVHVYGNIWNDTQMDKEINWQLYSLWSECVLLGFAIMLFKKQIEQKSDFPPHTHRHFLPLNPQWIAKNVSSNQLPLFQMLNWFLRLTQDFYTYMESSPLPVKGCKKFRLMAFEQGGIFNVPHLLCDTGPRFSGHIRRTAHVSRLLRHTRGCGRSILIQIRTGSKFLIHTHLCNWNAIAKKRRD
jgi:hypothetical protein